MASAPDSLATSRIRGTLRYDSADGRRADIPCLVGEIDVQGVAIELRIDGDRVEAEIAGGANHANGDLASVGDENGIHSEHPRKVDLRTAWSSSVRLRSRRRVTNGTAIGCLP